MIFRNAWLLGALLIAAIAGHSPVSSEQIQDNSTPVGLVDVHSSGRGVARFSVSSAAKRKLEKQIRKKLKNKSKRKKALKQLPKNVQRAIVRNRTRVHDGKIKANPKLRTQIATPTTKVKPDQTQK